MPTRRLLLSSHDAKIREIMVTKVITVPTTATVNDACQLFLAHKYLAFPVMHGERMVGIVDVELFAEGIDDLERTKQQENLFQLIGVHVSASQQASPWQAFLGRFPWLLCNIAGGILAAILTNQFEGLLQKVVALALFVPVVLALSESVAIQSVSLALLVLGGQPLSFATIRSRVVREGATGILLGFGLRHNHGPGGACLAAERQSRCLPAHRHQCRRHLLGRIRPRDAACPLPDGPRSAGRQRADRAGDRRYDHADDLLHGCPAPARPASVASQHIGTQ